jgi:hypothetical protein
MNHKESEDNDSAVFQLEIEYKEDLLFYNEQQVLKSSRLFMIANNYWNQLYNIVQPILLEEIYSSSQNHYLNAQIIRDVIENCVVSKLSEFGIQFISLSLTGSTVNYLSLPNMSDINMVLHVEQPLGCIDRIFMGDILKFLSNKCTESGFIIEKVIVNTRVPVLKMIHSISNTEVKNIFIKILS